MKNMEHKKEYRNYINRDLSWLKFNRRVLEEAQDGTTPLLERIKFLSIVSTNLDEFMSIRVAGIMDLVRAGFSKKDFTGYTPLGLFHRLMRKANNLVDDQYTTFHEVSRLLEKEGIIFINYNQLDSQQKKLMEAYFFEQVYPILTPMAIDPSRPFPLIRNQSMYLSVLLKQDVENSNKDFYFSMVQVPANVPRFINVSSPNTKMHLYLLLEDLIKEHLYSLYGQYKVIAANVFRLTRNADLTLNEEGAEDLLEEMEKELHRRRWGTPVRLEIEQNFHPYALQMIQEELEINEPSMLFVDGPIDLSFLMKMSHLIPGFEHLRYPKNEQLYPSELEKTENLFDVLKDRDILVFHPYETFEAVDDAIQHAAEDPSVLAIKMTLYRVSADSRIIRALIRAAELGKQVTVVLELKARFDEERNITWAKELEKAGCHVVFGLIGLKTHVKMTLIVRQEKEGLKRYVHVSTGNYNGISAQIYTDLGMFTSNSKIGEDITNLFNEITGFSIPYDWQSLCVSPKDLQHKLNYYIQREIDHALSGKPARIIAKINSLTNKEMVDQLYAASCAGVTIDLIIRGVCCLRPGVMGLSEHIHVRSIVDRFLEHSRIYYFENNGEQDLWLASADWMTRSFSNRIEMMCPIEDIHVKQRVTQILMLSLKDNVKARLLMPNGSYIRVQNLQDPIRSQFKARDILLERKELKETEKLTNNSKLNPFYHGDPSFLH
jgi:polyphosphate kinase